MIRLHVSQLKDGKPIFGLFNFELIDYVGSNVAILKKKSKRYLVFTANVRVIDKGFSGKIKSIVNNQEIIYFDIEMAERILKRLKFHNLDCGVLKKALLIK